MKFILWIDDEPNRFFPIENATVIFAHGFSQIKYYLDRSSFQFDLIILDHDMPGMNGEQVAREFLVAKNIPVIICSNNPGGRKNILSVLQEYDTDDYKYPVVESDIAADNFKNIVIDLVGK